MLENKNRIIIGLGTTAFLTIIFVIIYFFSLRANVTIFLWKVEKSEDVPKEEIVDLFHRMLEDDNVSVKDSEGRTPLMWAAALGNKNITRLILNEGAIVDAQDNQGNSALFYASFYQNANTLVYLLEKRADVSLKNQEGRESFGEMIYRLSKRESNGELSQKEQEILDLLLLKGANINSLDNDGNSALLIAAENSKENMFPYLVAGGASLEIRNKKFQSVLDIAVEKNDREVAEKILKLGMNLNSQDQAGQTAFHKSTKEQKTELSKLFIDKGADFIVEDNNNMTPLKYAVQNDDKEILGYFIESKGLAKDDYLDLFYQYRFINKDFLEKPDVIGSSFILRAAVTGDEKLLKFAYLLGADMQVKDTYGNTVLIILAQKNFIRSAKFLLDKEESMIDAVNNSGRSAISYAASEHNLEMVKLLVDHGARTDIRDRDGMTPFLYCFSGELKEDDVRTRNMEIASYLLEKGVEINEKDKDGETALFTAVMNGSKETVDFLVEKGADPNVGGTKTPITLAVSWKRVDIAGSLIKGGADVNVKNSLNKTMVFLAAENGDEEMVKLLASFGANFNYSTGDYMDHSDLMQLTFEGKYDAAKLLLKYGADKNYRNKYGKTVLGIAKDKKKNMELIRTGAIKVSGGNTTTSSVTKRQENAKKEAELNDFIQFLVDIGAEE